MATKNAGVARMKNLESSKYAENFNPNVSDEQSPGKQPLLFSNTCSSNNKSQKKSKKANPVGYSSPQNRIRQRKFVVAKKNKEGEGVVAASSSTVSSCKCKENKSGGGNDGNKSKCLCVAYQNLRKSQEEFFKNRPDDDDEGAAETESVLQEEQEELGNSDVCESEPANQEGNLIMKRTRERMMEDGKEIVPQSGSGKVMNLVKAFEKLLSIPTSKDEDHKEEPQENNKVMKWPMPGFQIPKESETEVAVSSFCPPNMTLTPENLGLDPRVSVSSSWDSSRASCSVSSDRRSRRNSLESSTTFGGRKWRKKHKKVTSQKPFKLRTEQRGKLKEEEFVKKIQEMVTEEEKQRIPVAQGLPWTTDEPECLVKPPVKEITMPIDLKLHSDVRAMDRAEFDHQVAEKLCLIEQYKLEKERQQKLAEEEELRRLRKELVPKAQPMPYFDRPFIPRRSMKNPTIPREPKFNKKIKCSFSSWNDISPYSSYLN
ncbi:microtubule-destabilizing protein 60-like [Gastrolobium bilobum]|uniref:microtubule-destabilizing protein 60-like n=1 Tax=Gastrolobium bilobum TaxID=150636 RepID=UPI002AB0B3F0|nr:microtubule-destabilizing protein 60-like [Gastrolobium bilobum]